MLQILTPSRATASRRLPATDVHTIRASSHRHRANLPASLASDGDKETNLERLRRLRLEIQELEEDVENERDTTQTVSAQMPTGGDVSIGEKWKGKGRQVSPAIILQQLQLLRGDLAQVRVNEAEHTSSGSGEKSDSLGKLLERQAQVSSSLLSTLSTNNGGLKPIETNTTASSSNTSTRQMTDGELESRITELEKIIGSSQANVDEVVSPSPFNALLY